MLVFIFDMELLKKYEIKNYDNNIKKLKTILTDNIHDVNDFIMQQPTGKLRIWIKITDYTIADNQNYRSESYLLITMIIKLFSLELDVENVSLSNSEIIKLLKRFSKVIKFEYAYRNTLIKKKPKYYTLLKDITLEENLI